MPKYSVTGEVDSFCRKRCVLSKEEDEGDRKKSVDSVAEETVARDRALSPPPDKTRHISLSDKVLR